MMNRKSAATVLALLLGLAACGDAVDSPTTTAGDPAGVAQSTTVPASELSGTTEPAPPSSMPGPVTSTSEPPTEPDPGAPLPTLPEPKIPGGLEPLVAGARRDLANVLGVDETTITLAIAESIVWPDAGLGCPQPGIEYAQVQVEGWRVVLSHDNTAYAYHGGGSRMDGFLCRRPNFPAP